MQTLVHLHDVAFALPGDAWREHTVNVFHPGDERDVSLTVLRFPLPADADLEDAARQALSRIQKSWDHPQLLSFQPRARGDDTSFEAQLIERGALEPVKRTLFLRAGDTLLAFVWSGTAACYATIEEHVEAVLRHTQTREQ